MNYSDKHKIVVLTPPRQATRTLGSIFQKLGVVNDFEHAFTHRLGIPSDKEDYTIISSIRNPYNRYLSIYKWQSIFTLENLHETAIGHLRDYQTLIDIDGEYGIDYWIDTENIKNDLMNIPVINQNLEIIQSDIDELDTFNSYKNEGRTVGKITQEIADQIYDEFKFVFDKFGYGRDSWK
jgi:hypothetical protein